MGAKPDISGELVEAFKAVVADALGPSTTVSVYGSEKRTPMSFVLERAQARLGYPLITLWAQDGAPDVFCLHDSEVVAVVFNRRHVELSAQLLKLFTSPIEGEMLEELAERLCLRVIAEYALYQRDADLAALTYLTSKVGESFIVPDPRNVDDLEYSPISERYMFIWFFGLVHEIGHEIASSQNRSRVIEELFSDNTISHLLQEMLNEEGFNPEHRKLADRMMAENEFFRPARLREEGSADIFACEILLQSTVDILNEIGAPPLDPVQFSFEHIYFINILTLIERCRIISLEASKESSPSEDGIIFLATHHLAIIFRAKLARQYLDIALTDLFGLADRETLVREIDKQNLALENRSQSIQRGYRKALHQALHLKEQLADYELLEAFRKEMLQSPVGVMVASEARAFCDAAGCAGTTGPLLSALREMLASPQQPAPLISSDSSQAYLLAWVEGPNGFSRPFSLQTKYGPLVFAFAANNPAFAIFFQESADGLRDEFKLQRVLVMPPRPQALGAMILARASDQGGFGLVYEGHSTFDDLIGELARGEIWPDEPT